MDIVEEIKARLSIEDVIAQYVHEQPNRSGYIHCPFHDEKTASLKIYPDQGTWHCYGCGKGGDQISFAREMFGLSFPAALTRIDSDFHLGLFGGTRDELAEGRRKADAIRRRIEAEREKQRDDDLQFLLCQLHRRLLTAYRIGYDSIDHDEACRILPALEDYFDERYYAACRESEAMRSGR